MSCSKPLPPFVCDSLYYLNRDQLERFSIVCRPLKKFIDRYFHSKPYRVIDELHIRAKSYALQWHPKRGTYSTQQFLDGPEPSSDEHTWDGNKYYSFAEIRPYLGQNVRIQLTKLYVGGEYARDPTYNRKQIAEMESLAYLWRDGNISIWNADEYCDRVDAEDFRAILNSPIILQCQELHLDNAHFSFKDFKVLYSVKVIHVFYLGYEYNPKYWPDFLEQPGVKPVVELHNFGRKFIDSLLDRLSKAFFSAVSPNAFKIVFVQYRAPLTEFQEMNKTSSEKLELKKGLPAEYRKEYLKAYDSYTLERSGI